MIKSVSIVKKHIALTFICLSLSIAGASAQSEGIAFTENVELARALMERGLYDESITLLDDTDNLDKTRTAVYSYEKALACYLKGDYKAAAKLLRKVIMFRDASDSVYRLLGDCYGLMERRDRALVVYEMGLEKFPYSSILYNGIAINHADRGDRDVAIDCFLTGIEYDPTYAPNWFGVANASLDSDDKAFGMIDGETAVCLDPDSEQSRAMGERLLGTYRENISFPGDTVVRVSFSDAKLSTGEQIELVTGTVSFPFLYEVLLKAAVGTDRTIDVPSLVEIRRRFVEFWFADDLQLYANYHTPLFDYHRAVIEAGHWEAYNYWLFSPGDPAAFEVWNAENSDKTEAFLEWFDRNSIIKEQ